MPPSTPAVQRAVFEDGLGKRHHAKAPNGALLEVLQLRDEFTTEAFEIALRERVAALAGLHTTWFSHVRTVQRVKQAGAPLFVVYDRVAGTRLSTVLATRQHSEPLEANATLYLIRQLVAAIALLHEKLPDVAHGAISVERVIITPDARVVVADHVFGSALEQQSYWPQRYWKELHIALPIEQPAFDQRADVMQIGTLALELILGRRITPVEYPHRLEELTERPWRTVADDADAAMPVEFRAWLRRMLQLDTGEAFASAVDAWADLEDILGGRDNGASYVALEAVMAGYATGVSANDAEPRADVPERARPDFAPPDSAPPDSARFDEPRLDSPRLEASAPVRSEEPPEAPVPSLESSPAALESAPAPQASASPAPSSDPPSAVADTAAYPSADHTDSSGDLEPSSTVPTTLVASPLPWHALAAPPGALTSEADWRTADPRAVIGLAETAPDVKRTMPPTRRRWMAVAAVLVLLAAGGAMFGRQYLLPSASAEAPGTLVVTTNPAGYQVFIDGQPRGVTPLTIELAPGAHELKIATEGEPRIIPFTVAAGSTVAQAIEVPKATPLTGQLMVHSEPAGARVMIDATLRGTTPLTIDGLTPGTLSVTLQNDLSSVTQDVTIEPGVRASLVVPMTAPQGVPASGWVSVVAPVEVEVHEGGRSLGTSQSDRLMLPSGPHTLEIVNQALGYRVTRSVTVVPGKVSPVRLEWPNGTMALNAQPWAEVWVNGKPLGETPIGSVTVPIGIHEVIFRHPELGEQVVRATVTATAPARVTVDLRRR